VNFRSSSLRCGPPFRRPPFLPSGADCAERPAGSRARPKARAKRTLDREDRSARYEVRPQHLTEANGRSPWQNAWAEAMKKRSRLNIQREHAQLRRSAEFVRLARKFASKWNRISNHGGWLLNTVRLGPYLKWSVSTFVLFTAIELLYVLEPSLPISKRRTVPDAAAVTVIWLLLAWGLGFYFHHFGELKFARFFRFLAAPALFMTWLVRAEVNSRLRRKRLRFLAIGAIGLPWSIGCPYAS
jgi:virulence factor BrkB